MVISDVGNELEEGKNMKRIFLLLVAIQIASTFALIVPRVSGEPYYLNLYPTKGTVSTNIVLKAFVPPQSNNWVYWDDVVIASNLAYDDQILGFALNLSCPNVAPYSDLGNHTVTVESYYVDNGSKVAYFNATFEITEYSPTSEYLALNATYYSLLVNYSDLLNSYNSLLANYNILVESNNNLLNNHTILLSNYNSLAANYNSLLADFNALTSNYNSLFTNSENLRSLYSLFLANYSSLLGSYQSLNSNYNTLVGNYNSLDNGYHNLETDYGTLLNELATTRILSYVLIATTIIFVATTVFLLTRRMKLTPRGK